MPTAGKVLSVLVALAILGGIFLSAQVAYLNRNWGERLTQIDKQLAEAEAAIPPLIDEIPQLKDQINLVQLEKEDQLTLYRNQLSKLQKADAYTAETLSRYQIQLATTQEQAEDAAQLRDARKNQLEATREDLRKTIAEVNQLADQNDQMIAQLQRLQASFLANHQEAESAIEKILSKNQGNSRPVARRRTRPASVVAPAR